MTQVTFVSCSVLRMLSCLVGWLSSLFVCLLVVVLFYRKTKVLLDAFPPVSKKAYLLYSQ